MKKWLLTELNIQFTGQLRLLAHVRLAAGQDKQNLANLQLRSKVRKEAQFHQSKISDAYHWHSGCHSGESQEVIEIFGHSRGRID